MGIDGNGRLQFGDFELDILSGKLCRDGRPVKIQPQPLRVLGVLLEQPGEIVSREHLRARIWGASTFIEFDQGLNYCIRQIRLALGDEASQPIYIETLPKQGYRFIASIAANGHIAEPALAMEPVPSPPPKKPHWKILGAAIALIAFVGAAALVRVMQPSAARQPAAYTQITSFTDAAVAPVLSPDGRMVAFYRSQRRFFTSDQIYAKMLPGGEPVQLTHDPRPKYNLAFSPDSSRIAYTVIDHGWHTYTVSSLGGDSTLFRPNSAGLTWIDQHRLLFSEIKTGVHMGIVTANADRSQYREIYFPAHERAMAHYSYASPNRKWALVVEMDPQWQPCRLIPLDGASPGRQVGPAGACTSAAWSPDGSWMYFGVEVQGRRHLWRQRFPDGQPEQMTSGPTEEDGVTVAPDGRSLITSISTKQNAVWIHDSRGDRALSTEGYADATPPLFSHDGKSVYYLLRHDSPESPSELWRADLDSGSSEAVVPGISMLKYDISNDEKQVVFSTKPSGQASQLWLAPLDRSSPPRMISASGEATPHFGPNGQVLFRYTDGNAYYVAKMGLDGSSRTKVFPSPILDFFGTSPDRRFALLSAPLRGSKIPGQGHVVAVALEGGPARRICDDYCLVRWSPDGKYFYIAIAPPSLTPPAGKTAVIPVVPGDSFPPLPASGIHPGDEGLAIPGIKFVEQSAIAPGLGSTYAYVKATMHANLFRIPLLQELR
jgi:DNA-binding winged helix-turn-helix (wHTH) protein/Tol biopolymer transport system component